MRKYTSYSLKGANYRICSSRTDTIQKEIRFQRKILIGYIKRHPEFLDALEPIGLEADPPEIVKRMQAASQKAGVGPMACVAGATAQLAAEAAVRNGANEAIVENGGDIYLVSEREILIGIYVQESLLSGKVAFRIAPSRLPVAICSSSSKMGHSLSFGDCNLATVLAEDAALADAVATQACNRVKTEEDMVSTAEKAVDISGVQGIWIVKNDKVGLAGDLPELVRLDDESFSQKITMDAKSNHILWIDSDSDPF